MSRPSRRARVVFMYFGVGFPRVLSVLPETQSHRQAVVALSFSPCGSLLAVVTSAAVQIWSGQQVILYRWFYLANFCAWLLNCA